MFDVRRIVAVAGAIVVLWIASAQVTNAGLAISTAGNPGHPSSKRIALVIGVAAYKHLSHINNTIRDAELVADTLTELGFDVRVVTDPTLSEMRSEIQDHSKKLSDAGDPISAIYYAGHGAEAGGATYLVSREVKINDATDLKLNSITLAEMIASVTAAAPLATSFYFIDTSRSNPFNSGDESKRLVPSSRDVTALESGSAVIYSTSAGAEALDGDGENGPFALALTEQLKKPGLEFSALMRAVRNDVLEATAGKQLPHEIIALRGDFFFQQADQQDAPVEPPETKAAKVLYRASDGELVTTYADGSYALLIGVGDYEETGTGRQAWNDLKHVEDELTRLGGVLENIHGFEVDKVFDPTGDELEAALETFVNLHGPKPNARLLIMMSGHGTTTEKYGRKTAWFVPSDAPATEPPAPFLNTALNLRRVEEWSEIMAAKHVMWIFDSCFSGAAIRMIESKSGEKPDGWAEHLHQNPVRRVLTAGSENEEVPAKSRFTETLISVLSGQTAVEGAGDYITGQQLGLHLKEDVIRYNFKQRLPKNTPQSDTIVIPGEEGDVVFSIDAELSARWLASAR